VFVAGPNKHDSCSDYCSREYSNMDEWTNDDVCDPFNKYFDRSSETDDHP
jgi:hypothetical protein